MKTDNTGHFAILILNLQQVYYLKINIIIYDPIDSHSTQRNESANRDIKRFINHYVRTKFIKIVEIFKAININEEIKVLTKFWYLT